MQLLPPHLLQKEPIPEITHPGLQEAIEHVRTRASQQEALNAAFEIITTRYHSMLMLTYVLLWRAYEMNPNILWKRTHYLHCTQQNYLLRVLLVTSGWFTEADITLGYSLVFFISPHQYLQVSVGGQIVAVDPWHGARGAQLGQYAFGFGYKSITH